MFSTRTLLFNIFLNDIFYFIIYGYLGNYTADNTLYSIGNNLNMIKQKLKINLLIMQKWFMKTIRF